jgi:hypothetical protein
LIELKMTDNNMNIVVYGSTSTIRPRPKRQNHLKNAAIIIFASICAPIASIVTVKAAGFTKSGVTKGSIAAYLMRQWSIYLGGAIGKRSLISVLQNLGAKGSHYLRI